MFYEFRLAERLQLNHPIHQMFYLFMSAPELSPMTSLPDWVRTHPICCRGEIKREPEDFRVEEVLGFEPDGQGEHLLILVEKSGMNTLELVKQLSRQLAIPAKQIAWSGLKDRHAVTRQWLSIWSAQSLELSSLAERIDLPGVRLLQAGLHGQKLKRGTHRANRFEIILRDLMDCDQLEGAVETVRIDGVPNYFGEQRFGRQGRNIDKATAMFGSTRRMDRQQRSLYLSAARSYLFNYILSLRVAQGNWSDGLPGELLMLAGSRSFFHSDEIDKTLRQRLSVHDIHPSIPLWGRGALQSTGEAFELESCLPVEFPVLTAGLEAAGLRQQRRASRLIAQQLEFEWLDDSTARICFTLERGSFATVVLRELLQYSE